MKNKKAYYFQDIISYLKKYWSKKGCTILQPIDIEVGAGTFHPFTFFESLNKKKSSFAYVQPSRRPSDSRNGKYSNRLQKYYQFQVMIKPSPLNLQDLYLQSLEYLGINTMKNDIRFVEDNWENTTLGAWGIGWEVWLNGMEISQFTYFQQMGGIDCTNIPGEITYGLERLSMCIQRADNVYDIIWNKNNINDVSYKDLFYDHEIDHSLYNFDFSNIEFLFDCFKKYENESYSLINLSIPLIFSSYEFLIKSIHIFNLIDARKIISATERKQYILRIRNLTKNIAQCYIKNK